MRVRKKSMQEARFLYLISIAHIIAEITIIIGFFIFFIIVLKAAGIF